MKIAVFGGSFNPPHVGHLIVLESIREQFQYDRVLFVPSAQPPNKREATLVPARLRLEMTRLAVEGNPAFDVSDIEVRRDGLSYTIDTILELRSTYPGASFSLVIGYDNFLEFDTWKSADEILANADLVVMNRPGYAPAPGHQSYAKIARYANVPQIGISGTDIRRRIKLGRSIRYLVPQRVEQFIHQRRLYRD